MLGWVNSTLLYQVINDICVIIDMGLTLIIDMGLNCLTLSSSTIPSNKDDNYTERYHNSLK